MHKKPHCGPILPLGEQFEQTCLYTFELFCKMVFEKNIDKDFLYILLCKFFYPIVAPPNTGDFNKLKSTLTKGSSTQIETIMAKWILSRRF